MNEFKKEVLLLLNTLDGIKTCTVGCKVKGAMTWLVFSQINGIGLELWLTYFNSKKDFRCHFRALDNEQENFLMLADIKEEYIKVMQDWGEARQISDWNELDFKYNRED